ncbi:hypothetical protein B7R78_0005200 [Ralstonia solanacearum]|nr:hypothetical protein [Ralstonia solanacearum]
MERLDNSEQLLQQLRASLQSMPGVTSEVEALEFAGRNPKVDAVVALKLPNHAYTVLVQFKRTVYPRDARDVIWKSEMLREVRQPLSNTLPTVPMVVAESISDGAKELLRSEQVAYFDSGGSLFLDAPGAYLYVDKAAPKALRKTVGSLFTGKRAQVMHAMLVHHHKWLGVSTLAKLSQVSTATVSEVMREAERFDWMDVRGQGPSKERMLTMPGPLLDTWAKQAPPAPVESQRYFVPRLKGNELVAQLHRCMADAQAHYVLTAEAAAQRYAPFLSQLSLIRSRAGGPSAVHEALQTLGARPVEEGANLEVAPLQVPSDLLFRNLADGMWLASPVLVYLQLLRAEGRSKELAEHLRQTKLGY